MEDYFEQFTPLQAEAGLAMLGKVEVEDAGRIANVEKIKGSLPQRGDPWPRTLEGCRNVYWQFVVYLSDRRKIERALEKRGIDTGTTNLSLISGLGIYPEYETSCPNAEFVKHHAFLVPVYPRLSARDLERVGNALREVIPEKGGVPIKGQV